MAKNPIKKMSLMGVADKILIVMLISLAVLEGISLALEPAFKIAANRRILVIPAVAIAATGFALNLIAAVGMLRAHQCGQLATTGLYALLLNPMYAFQLLITVPGLLLLLNSWLSLLTIVPTFIAFKVYAKEEERYLEEKFGARYTEYRSKVLLKFL